MAPEEFQKGAKIDQVTNVFTLGKTADILLLTGEQSSVDYSPLQEIIDKACSPRRSDRFQSVADYISVWMNVIEGIGKGD